MYARIGSALFVCALVAIVISFGAAVLMESPSAQRAVIEPAAPSGLVVLRDDAPAWCLDPSYPRGDQWYESCAEPVR
jgi:hypothetical protein